MHVFFWSIDSFNQANFLYLGVLFREKNELFFYEQYAVLLEKGSLSYSWREVPYELKSN